jgi:hypothetical protein
MGLELDASLGITLGDFTTGLDKLGDRLDKREPRPIYSTLTKSRIYKSTDTAPFGLDLGSPNVGYIWQLRFVTMFGNDDHTVLSGISASVYAGDFYNPTLANLKIVGAPIPSTQYVPDTVMWVHPGESLYVLTSTTPTVGQQIGANIGVEIWRERDVSMNAG